MPHGLDQARRIGDVIGLQLLASDPGTVNRIAWIARQHSPLHRLTKRLLEDAVHVVDATR